MIESKITRTINGLLNDLNIILTIIQSNEIKSIMKGNKDSIVNDELAESIVHILFHLTIHNDCQGTTIKKKNNIIRIMLCY